MPPWHTSVILRPQRGVCDMVGSIRLLQSGVRIFKKKRKKKKKKKKKEKVFPVTQRNTKVCIHTLLSLHCYHPDQSLVTQPTRQKNDPT